MAPSSLQGLNLIHPPHSTSQSQTQDLLSGPPFPDLLWSNLVFDSDDGPVADDKYSKRPGNDQEEVDLDEHTRDANSNAHHQEQEQQPAFDLNAFLANLSQPPAATTIAPSLVQLLALHSAIQSPPGATSFQAPQVQQHQSAASSTSSTPKTSQEDYPPAKRARARRSSVSTVDSPQDEAANGVSAAEDKRRRNTAASARFRLKKKEREAALESKAKELEGRVNELERECEGLRRENGWLKGLVVGVTGAAQGTQPVQTGSKRGRDELDG